MRRDRFKYHTAGGNFGSAADFDIAEHFRPGADEHAFADFWMPIAGVLAGSSQRYGLHEGNVVFNHGGFTNDDTRGVVQHDAFANFGGGVNVYSEDHRNQVLHKQRHRAAVLLPQ